MIRKLIKLHQRLRHNDSGTTLIEFAFVAPVFIMMLMALFDFGYTSYVRAVLNGAVQLAARNSSLEGAAVDDGTTAIDTRVRDAINDIGRIRDPNTTDSDDSLANDAECIDGICISRLSYFTFADVSRPEAFADSNGDAICNNNEAFEDENGNDEWDDDVGEEGLGGARDIVLYTVSVTYYRMFPLHKFLGDSETNTVSVSTVLQNQPYALQDEEAEITAGICT